MTKRAATRVADLLNPAAMLLPAANVIMQLSLPGSAMACWKARSTAETSTSIPSSGPALPGTYLAVATIGSDADRELIRAAVEPHTARFGRPLRVRCPTTPLVHGCSSG
jgi:uncharacterized protein (DUF2236 family)